MSAFPGLALALAATVLTMALVLVLFRVLGLDCEIGLHRWKAHQMRKFDGTVYAARRCKRCGLVQTTLRLGR